MDIRFLSKGRGGGISEYTVNLLDTLFALDNSNEYFLLYTGIRRVPLPYRWERIKNVQVIEKSISNRYLEVWMKLFGTPSFIKDLKLDLVFSPHLLFIEAGDIPQVMTFHDLSFLRFEEFFSRKSIIWHKLQRFYQKGNSATHLIADSNFTKSDLVKFLGVEEKKVSVIYPGVSEVFKPVSFDNLILKNVLKKYGLKVPYILYLGEIQPRKNLEVIIDAYTELKNRLPELELVIAGGLGYRGKDVKMEGVRYLGHVPDEDRLYLYSGARVFVYPSFFEGFGLPPLEAQACGIPVIASDRSSLVEVLGDSAILLSPWDTSGYIDAIYLLCTDEKKRRSIMSKGLKNVKRFSWRDSALNLLKVFLYAKKK